MPYCESFLFSRKQNLEESNFDIFFHKIYSFVYLNLTRTLFSVRCKECKYKKSKGTKKFPFLLSLVLLNCVVENFVLKLMFKNC